jgi:hypothetical protein
LFCPGDNLVVPPSHPCLDASVPSSACCDIVVQGLGLGLIQLALKILYPAKKKGRKGENAARPSLEVSSTAQTIAVVGTDETIESNKTDNLAPDERRELPETSSSP